MAAGRVRRPNAKEAVAFTTTELPIRREPVNFARFPAVPLVGMALVALRSKTLRPKTTASVPNSPRHESAPPGRVARAR